MTVFILLIAIVVFLVALAVFLVAVGTLVDYLRHKATRAAYDFDKETPPPGWKGKP